MKDFFKTYAPISMLALSQVYLIVAKLIGYTNLPWLLVSVPTLAIAAVIVILVGVYAVLRFFIKDYTNED